MVEDIQLANNC